jgi:Mn-dependent DtxR family transcriptional regulator
MLGVNRGSASETASVLQGAGLIRHRHGRIISLNRSDLEVAVCECYCIVKSEFDRLFRA